MLVVKRRIDDRAEIDGGAPRAEARIWYGAVFQGFEDQRNSFLFAVPVLKRCAQHSCAPWSRWSAENDEAIDPGAQTEHRSLAGSVENGQASSSPAGFFGYQRG